MRATPHPPLPTPPTSRYHQRLPHRQPLLHLLLLPAPLRLRRQLLPPPSPRLPVFFLKKKPLNPKLICACMPVLGQLRERIRTPKPKP
jgi:hypothetical protein